VLLFVLILSSSPILISQQSVTAPQRDQQAVALAQQSLAAMGGAQALSLGDSVATGQVQSFRPDGTSVAFPITKKSKGSKMLRTEVQRPEGTRLIIINNGMGTVQKPDGTSPHSRFSPSGNLPPRKFVSSAQTR
jgi:hypothetical protein